MAETLRLRLATLARFGVLLALTVIMLGAWTRLRDAGLGCPDWPTCYGHLTVPADPASLARAAEQFPGQVVVPAKAWPETIHRYFASSIGAVILVLAVWMLRRRMQGLPWRHGLGLLALVCLQGGFGALTVTEKLFPPVVTGHLLLGFSTLTLLFLLMLRLSRAFPATGDRGAARMLPWVWLVLPVLVLQIMLGGWTASNYAATVCTELPVCQAGWQSVWAPDEAFRLFRPDDRSWEYAPHLDAAAKITIHAAHRIGAMVTAGALLLLAVFLWRRTRHSRYRRFALALCAGVLAQVGLGVMNVVAHLPLWNAVAHNVCAAILLQVLVALGFALHREQQEEDRGVS